MQCAARLVLALALVAMLVAQANGGAAAAAVFVSSSLLVPGALLVSSVPESRSPGGRVGAALALTVLLESGAWMLLAGPSFPHGAWIMLGLLGGAPLLVVPVIHAIRARSGVERP